MSNDIIAVQDEAPKAAKLSGSRRDVTVDLVQFTRALAGCRGNSALEMLAKAKAEADLNTAAVLAMYAGSYAAQAFTFARMTLDYAAQLGWYPATFVNSDWWLTGPPAAALGASRPSPASDFKTVVRFEVIDESGRAYVVKPCSIELSVQDDGTTLKVFVTKG